jgi:DNA-binding MurR/RpiR family transcriptional regulator
MLTKKDYKAIAEIIRSAGYKWLYLKRISSDLADYFEQDNPAFDRAKFINACFKD